MMGLVLLRKTKKNLLGNVRGVDKLNYMTNILASNVDIDGIERRDVCSTIRKMRTN